MTAKTVVHFCSWCQQAYKVGDGAWTKTTKDDYLNREISCRESGDTLTHGICPDCHPAFKLKCQEAARSHATKKSEPAPEAAPQGETPQKT